MPKSFNAIGQELSRHISTPLQLEEVEQEAEDAESPITIEQILSVRERRPECRIHHGSSMHLAPTWAFA